MSSARPTPESLLLCHGPPACLIGDGGRYLKSILLVAIVTGLNSIIFVNLEPTNLVMFFLAAVVFAAMFWGRGPSILASFLSVLAFDFFFVYSYYSFAVSDTEYIVTFIGLLIVGLVISSLASLLRDQLDQIRKREISSPDCEFTRARAYSSSESRSCFQGGH